MPADEGRRHPADLADWQAATLVPFGTALYRRWPFDLIHAHTGLPDGVAASALADRLGIPLVVTEHDSSVSRRLADPRSAAAYRRLVGDRRRLLAVSPSLAAAVAAGSGIAAEAIGVVPNMVDLGAFRPDAATPRDGDELLWVGAIKGSKGIGELLEAVAAVSVRRPSIHLRLIGAAPSRQEEDGLRARAAELGIADRVVFEPPVDRAGVAAAMARAGVFVHPSPYETFGIVAVEALAAGLPVVGVAPAVIDNIGRDGVRGIASAGPDAASLSIAIEAALDRRDGFDPAVLAASAAPFGETVVAATLLRVYEDLLAGATATAGPAATSCFPVQGPVPAPVIVALHRRADAAAIETLSARVRSAATVVVLAARQARDAVATSDGWTRVDVDLQYRAALRGLGVDPDAGQASGAIGRAVLAALHPRRTVARRRLARERPAMAETARLEAVRAALERPSPETGPDGTPSLAVAVEIRARFYIQSACRGQAEQRVDHLGRPAPRGRWPRTGRGRTAAGGPRGSGPMR